MSSKLVIFDLDGTLNKTELFTVPATQQVLKEFNAGEFSREEILSMMGGVVYEFAQKYLPDRSKEEQDRFMKRLGEVERDYMKINCGTFDGVMESLIKLKENGYKTAVCSNAFLPYISRVITALGMEPYMDYKRPLIEGKTKIDTLGILLEEVKPDKAVMVGDRLYDLQAARANNIPFIGCLYGYGKAEMRDSDLCVKTGFEIFDAVKQLLG